MPLTTHVRLMLAAVLAATACNDGPTAVTPLANATPLAIQSINTTTVPTDGLPRASAVGIAGGVEVTLDVVGACLMTVEPRATYAGTRVDVWVKRWGDPTANCAPGVIGFEYDLTAMGLGAGRYDVRVIDQVGDQPARVVGRATVTVLPAS